MNRITPILIAIGAGGFLTSLTLYILTFWNVNAFATPVYMPLTALLFVTWLTAILKLKKNPEVRVHQKSKSMNPLTFFKILLKGIPTWLKALAGISFIFAMGSFVYLMYSQPGVVSIIDGEKVLHNHGNIIKYLTEEEYIEALAIQSRGFVGHYLAFFGVGTAILWPTKNSEKQSL